MYFFGFYLSLRGSLWMASFDDGSYLSWADVDAI